MPREAKITSKHGKPLGTFDDDVQHFFNIILWNLLIFHYFNKIYIYILIREKKKIHSKKKE